MELLALLPDPSAWVGLLELFVKASLILCLGLYVTSQFSLSAAAVRHRILVGTLLSMALIPVISWFVPVLPIPALQHLPSRTPGTGALLVPSLLMVYGLVAVARASILCRQVVRTALISARATPAPASWNQLFDADQGGPEVRLRLSREIQSPLTWGVLHPVVLWPQHAAHWPHSEKRMILLHELAHIERGDWLTQLMAQWVGILYWPIPGLRRVLSKLSLSAEQACDDAVLSAGTDPVAYANMLLQRARSQRLPATVALGQASELSIRIRYLVAEIVDRSSTRARRAWTYATCTVLMLPLTAVHLTPEPPVYRFSPLYRAGTEQVPPAANTPTQWTRPQRPAPVDTPPAPPSVGESGYSLPDLAGEKPTIPPP